MKQGREQAEVGVRAAEVTVSATACGAGQGVRVWRACHRLRWSRQEEAGRVTRLQRGVRARRGGDTGQVTGGGEVGAAGPGA